MIVNDDLLNRKGVLNDIRSNKNVGEAKSTEKSSVARANHRKEAPLPTTMEEGKED
jgi:hypothetical protein